MSQNDQQQQHPHAAQRDVVQHAPSPATSPPGRRVHASRNHPAEKTPCSSTPIQSARLLQAAHQQRVEALQSACPAARRRRACGLAARVMCRPWLLRSDASSTRSAARCPRCRETCHRCGENSLHERTRATSLPRLNSIPWDGGTFPLPHLEPLPASWAAHHPVATLASHRAHFGFFVMKRLSNAVVAFVTIRIKTRMTGSSSDEYSSHLGGPQNWLHNR